MADTASTSVAGVNASRPSATVDGKLYVELVKQLYSTPKSIQTASIVAVSISLVAVALSGDHAYYTYASAFVVIGLMRTLSVFLFRRADADAMDLRTLQAWEKTALAGAWAFAALTGTIGAYSMIAHPGDEVEILTSCCAIGYIAGLSSRNASRPIITIGQISAICVPFLIGLVWRADILHITLAVFILSLYASTIYMARSIHENIVLRHRAHAELERAAHYDALTGLKNRSAFIKLVNQWLMREADSGAMIALMAVDLDRFKDVNDRLGHPAGDAVLKETARRLESVLEGPHELARIGGDEFLVALYGATPEATEAVAQRILGVLDDCFMIGPTEIFCGASIGFAIGPDQGRNFDELMRNADLALYSAKSGGRGQAVAYNLVLSELYHDRMELEYDMRTAISNDEFELVYQPIVDQRTGRTVCCEALLRWNHPSRGRIPPGEFIPIAEATGLIVPIGAWALKAACAEAATWPSDIRVAVNLSPLQFRKGREIVETVRDALVSTGLAPHRLDLEVTESVLIEDTEQTLGIIEQFRADGIGVSLDDFGTGFSSLGYLNDFPFSKLKIDRKFCQRVVGSPRTQSIIRGISQLTRDLGIELVAEGIEDRDQLGCMRGLGINAIQGFLFCRPLPVQQLRTVIRSPIFAPTEQAKKSRNKSAA